MPQSLCKVDRKPLRMDAHDSPHAAAQRDHRSQDIGNIVEFGHINLRVPDQQQAMAFYVMGLGLTRDPYLTVGVDNAWINVGSRQFHLPVGPAQVLRGRVGLVLPDIDALLERLAAVAPRLQGTRFSFVRDGAQVDIRCPWGNRIYVHAPDASRFGRMALGMPYLEIDAAPGTLASIARFYTEILAAPAVVTDDGESPCVRISAGVDGWLLFRETERSLPLYDGHHIQITVADFSGVHRRLAERGLVTEESNPSQYRFQNIVDLDSGQTVATLEHEVRSMRHPLYARPLVNRAVAVTNSRYNAGHEAAPWCLPPA